MKRISLISIILLLLVFTIACEGKKDNNRNQGPALSSLSNDELIERGWRSFSNNNFKDAEDCFDELTKRENVHVLGHHGLGWVFFRTFQYRNAQIQFLRAVSDPTNPIAGPLLTENRAGRVLVYHTLGEHQTAFDISQTGGFITTNRNWRFTHDNRICSIDVRLARAMSLIALGRYSDSLITIRNIDPTFTFDETTLNTVEGRLRFHERVEEMLLARRR